MKGEHEAKLDRNEMNMLRWMCGFSVKEDLKVRELLGLDSVSLSIKRSRLWWFGHVELKDDADRLAQVMDEDGV